MEVAGSNWLAAIVMFALLGGAATIYLRRFRLPREETAAGIAALAGMRWRDFIHLLLAALNKRGYERVFDPDAASADESDYLLERDGRRWLLSCKHGAAYVLGPAAITELANNIRMRGAEGGLLVTPGQFEAEAVRLAAAQGIELLDGARLWPELRPLISAEQRAAVTAPALANMRRQFVLAWTGALLVAVVLLLLPPREVAPDAGATSASTRATAAARTAAPAMSPAATASGIAAASAPPTDPAQLEQRRREVTRVVGTLPKVDRALWSTQSTLLVYLLDQNADPMPEICPLLEHYEELRASRIQLQPPSGSTRPVRFLQCHTY
ncbi:restriction endonuclease [Luteimonas weifangensis]|uniref:Restriction endonuclease n=1 Tax=Cognatiluteimonas weifangensis TaxID=2303539 RepID=A0A372DNZ6_9GAMM|nr:restriction endonuclease [Luteimonas weifangensis]